MIKGQETVRRRLVALRANLPEGHVVKVFPYVREFHRRIGDLEKLGVDAATEFRIGEGEMKFHRGEDPGRYVERAFLLAQLDALILCLEPEPADRRIGFKT